MKKHTKKLSLNRETLKQLDTAKLDKVWGGTFRECGAIQIPIIKTVVCGVLTSNTGTWCTGRCD